MIVGPLTASNCPVAGKPNSRYAHVKKNIAFLAQVTGSSIDRLLANAVAFRCSLTAISHRMHRISFGLRSSWGLHTRAPKGHRNKRIIDVGSRRFCWWDMKPQTRGTCKKTLPNSMRRNSRIFQAAAPNIKNPNVIQEAFRTVLMLGMAVCHTAMLSICAVRNAS